MRGQANAERDGLQRERHVRNEAQIRLYQMGINSGKEPPPLQEESDDDGEATCTAAFRICVRDHNEVVNSFIPNKDVTLGCISPYGEHNLAIYPDILKETQAGDEDGLNECTAMWAGNAYKYFVQESRSPGNGIANGPTGQEFLVEQFPKMMPDSAWNVGHLGQNGGEVMNWAFTCRGNGMDRVLTGVWHYGGNDGLSTLLSTSGLSLEQMVSFVETQQKYMHENLNSKESSVVWMPYTPLGLLELWKNWPHLPIIDIDSKEQGAERALFKSLLSCWDELEVSHLAWMRGMLQDRKDNGCGVMVLIVEPVLACAPMGLRPSYLQGLYTLCNDMGVLFVVDEIMTRTKCCGFLLVASESYTLPGGKVPAHMVVLGKFNLGVALVHEDAPFELRAQHTDNMVVNGKLCPVRTNPAITNGPLDMVIRELVQLKRRGLLEEDQHAWVALNKEVGQNLAVQIVKDVHTSRKRVQVVGMGCLLYANMLLTVRRDAGVQCMERFIKLGSAETGSRGGRVKRRRGDAVNVMPGVCVCSHFLNSVTLMATFISPWTKLSACVTLDMKPSSLL